MNRHKLDTVYKETMQNAAHTIYHLIDELYSTVNEEEGYEIRKTLLKKARTDMDSILYDIEKKILSLEKETK